MKVKIVFFTLLVAAVALSGLPPARAKTDILRDMVDIGNTSSEAGHNLLSWGPIEPDTHPATGWEPSLA